MLRKNRESQQIITQSKQVNGLTSKGGWRLCREIGLCLVGAKVNVRCSEGIADFKAEIPGKGMEYLVQYVWLKS